MIARPKSSLGLWIASVISGLHSLLLFYCYHYVVYNVIPDIPDMIYRLYTANAVACSHSVPLPMLHGDNGFSLITIMTIKKASCRLR